MTTLLHTAFDEASKLQIRDQNALAQWILELLRSEQRWDALFAQSQNALSKLAEEARREHCQGKTQLLTPEKL